MAPKVRRRPTALIVHDRDTREMYSSFLSSVGVNAIEAEDGLNGLAKALTILPDIVTVDLRLPRLTGLQLCRLLKQQTRTHAIPVIALSDSAEQGEMQAARTAGCVSVLIKPCLPQILLGEIKRVLVLP